MCWGNAGSPFYDKSTTTPNADWHLKTTQQAKITFEDCTFQDCYDSSSTERGLYTYGSVIKLKNCTFAGVDDALSRGVQAMYGARILLQGGLAGQTWTNVTTELVFSTSYNVAFYEVYELDLTVQDSEGSPIEGAIVSVRQKEGHETHSFITDSNGNIKDCNYDDPVFVYGEILSNTPTYNLWSDGTGNQVHELMISHPDYVTDTREVTFDQNRTIVAVLGATPPGATIIYGSTLYGSEIH